MAAGDRALTVAAAWRARAAVAPAVAVLAVLFGGALAGAIRTSVVPLPGAPATLDAWRELAADPPFAEAVMFTLALAAAATVLSAALALGIALVLRGASGGVRALGVAPVAVPPLLVAVLAVLWLAPGGLADRLLGGLPVELVRDRLGLGVLLVYVVKETPFLLLLLLAVMGTGLREREEACAALGAGLGQRVRWVVWPAVRRPLLAGSVVVAAFVVGAFEVPLAVGPNQPVTIAEYARQATQDDVLAGESRQAAALLVAAGLSLVLGAVAAGVARRAGDA